MTCQPQPLPETSFSGTRGMMWKDASLPFLGQCFFSVEAGAVLLRWELGHYSPGSGQPRLGSGAVLLPRQCTAHPRRPFMAYSSVHSSGNLRDLWPLLTAHRLRGEGPQHMWKVWCGAPRPRWELFLQTGTTFLCELTDYLENTRKGDEASYQHTHITTFT